MLPQPPPMTPLQQPEPGRIKVFGVIHIVFGAIGVLMGLLTVLVLIGMPALLKFFEETMTEGAKPGDPGVEAMTTVFGAMRELFSDLAIPNWVQASLRRTFLFPETNLDQWWGVDVDESGTQDIEVFFEPVPEQWQIGSIFDLAVQVFTEDILELGITVEYNIHKLESSDANFTSPEFQYHLNPAGTEARHTCTDKADHPTFNLKPDT